MQCNLHVDGVSHRYRGAAVDALAGVELSLGPGIVGLLGPNGAGKSTLMRILATLARPTAGRVRWNGVDTGANPDPLRTVLGYLPQDFGVYPALTAREFLAYLAAVKGLPTGLARERVEQALVQVGLVDAADRRLGGFSGGMRQRVGIAQALLNDPRVLIVDEPTVGLDPEERLRFRHLITDLGADRLVLLSTHIVSDVEASAGAIAVLAKGRLLFHGDPDTLIAQARGHAWDWTVPESALAEARARHAISSSLRRPDGIALRLVAAEAPSADAVPAEPDLEDAYLWMLEAQGAR